MRHAFDADHIARDRQHDPQADGRRPAAARRRVLLLARPLDDRLRARRCCSPSASAALSGAVATTARRCTTATGLVGTVGLRARSCYVIGLLNLLVLVGIVRVFRRMRARRVRRGRARGRSSTRAAFMNRFYGRVDAVDHASRGRCTRSGCCSGSASTPRPRSRCSSSPPAPPRRRAAVLRDPLPADPVRGGHVAAGHDRRRVHELRLRLGVLASRCARSSTTSRSPALSVVDRAASSGRSSCCGPRPRARPARRRLGLRRRRRPQHRRATSIVGLFVATWAVALAVWRFGRIEERWSAEPPH